MNKHLWPLALLPLTAAAGPALAYDVQSDKHTDNSTDWAYTDSSYSPNALHYRPWHFQIQGGPTITQEAEAKNLSNGWNAGAGLTWYPSRYLPLGFRADASYSKFDARQPLLDQAASQAGTNVDSGTIQRWGGDLDAELDIPLGPETRLYLLGGVGWYKSQATYRQNYPVQTTVCSWWGCVDAFINQSAVVQQATSDRQFTRNVGLGVEWGLAPGTSFYVEARYMRAGAMSLKQDFIPVHFGLRF
jgi:opacity protein-like surface antigen